MQPPGCREAVEQGRADATLLKSTACATVDQNVHGADAGRPSDAGHARGRAAGSDDREVAVDGSVRGGLIEHRWDPEEA